MKLRLITLSVLFVLAALQSTAQLPTDFIENKGQWSSWIKYKAQTMGGEVHLEKDGFRYILCDPLNVLRIDSLHTGALTIKPVMRFHVYKMTFEGAIEPAIIGERQQKNYYNYFLGKDSARWKTGIHPDLALNYNHLYPGVNMHITAAAGSLIYEFFVQPGADVRQIKMKFEGQENLKLDKGNLLINTTVGQVVEMKPEAFQYIDNEKVVVACKYQLKNNKVTFEFPEDYDHAYQLIIDPTVAFWCSFTGSTADNWGFTATYDNSGNFYLGGLVNALAIAGGGSFPVSPGAYQSTFAGGQGVSAIEYGADIGIMKLSADGTSRIYATYLGGANNERPHSLIVDAADNLIIVGKTHSTDFPITPGAFRTSNTGGWDMIVTKLNASGTALIGSTYIGGTADDGLNFDSTEVGYGHLKYNYGDDARSEVQVDNSGNIYVASNTNSADFPTTIGALSGSFGGGFQDGVVCKFNSNLTSLIYSSYIGGIGDDAAYVITFNKTQSSFYIAGGTNSTNFPVTPGAWHPSYGGDSADGFILKFKNSSPYTLQRGTFVGTANFDQVYGIQTDDTGNVYVMGQSLGGTFPVTAGVYNNANSSQFVMKMDSNLTSDLVSTVYGSGDPAHTNISPVAFLVDTCNNVYISGWGGNIMGVFAAPGLAHSGTTTGMPTTSDAIQNTTDGFDFYFLVLGPGMTTLRYASFYGRNAPGGLGEHVDGGTSRFSKQGIIYQAICANCGGPSGIPFPTTAGVWAPTDLSINCNEAALKIAFNIGPVTADIVAGPNTKGCAPLLINFTNLSNNGLSFIWDFGDGSPTSTLFSPTHTFVGAGVYTVTLSAANSNACFRTNDTAHVIIFVGTNVIKPTFTYVLTDSCGPYAANFINTSVDTVGIPSYQWFFGDGGSYTGVTPPNHTFPDTGTYVVMLIMTDTAACKSPDTVTHVVRFFSMPVGGSFIIPDSICLGTSFIPKVTLTNVTTTTWTFGDGQSSTSTDPSHLYGGIGSYTVTLIAKNTGGCGGGDTAIEVIKVLPVPIANFSYTPTVPIANVPTSFTNLSQRADRYAWDFGDKLSSVEENPVHQYNKTGNYKVCLTAYNPSNCPSMLCKMASAEVDPLLGLPTAFSPNGDGQNDILYVRGAAISTMDLKIFNRWGQLIFESTSLLKGWDGTFNGLPQPIEAYAYVLNATFIDGTAKLLKGNVTLLR
jgi:gliding motility-associated-like protein